MKFEGSQRVLKLLSGNGFHSSGHCDLDLWHTDPNINRGILLNKGYHPMKFEGSGSKGTWVIERKRSVTDGQTARRIDGQTDRRTRQKQYVSPRGGRHNRGLLLNQGYHPMKFEGSGSKGTRVIERKRFSLFGSLWSWPLTHWPKDC